MWLKSLTNYLLQHRWQTIAFTFILTFIPVLGIVGILIAALFTLCEGILPGAILTVAATLPYLISFFVSGVQEPNIPLVVWAAMSVAVLSNVLTWVFAVMLREHASWSRVLEVAALLGVLIVSVIHLLYPGIADWWGTQLQTYYAHAQAVGMIKTPVGMSNDTQLETIKYTRQYATGLMITAILFNSILQLIVARWWQAIIFSPGSLRKELYYIRLGQLAGFLFIASLGFSYLGNSVVLDVMPILYMLFGAAGLSLIHYFFGLMKSNTTWFWLSLFYVALILSLPVSLILISFLALVDIWLNMRTRFKAI